MLVEEHNMGCVVCLDCTDNTALLPLLCVSAERFTEGESMLSEGFYYRHEAKDKGPSPKKLSLARVERPCLR